MGRKSDKFSFGHVEFEMRHLNRDVQEIVGNTKLNPILVDCNIVKACSFWTLLYWACP